MLKKIRERIEGQGLVEYALILILVAVVVIFALSLLGPGVGNTFSTVVDALTYDGQGSGNDPSTDPASDPPSDPSPDPPPECYGSLLLPAMIGITGLGVGFSHLLAKRPQRAPVV
jgi:pilus assembly protein Flp/PilA